MLLFEKWKKKLTDINSYIFFRLKTLVQNNASLSKALPDIFALLSQFI